MKNIGITTAAVAAFFLLPFLSLAQVVCTDVNPDITNSGNASLDIDLNNDNTPDFRLTSAQISTLSFVTAQGSQIGTNNFVLTDGAGAALSLSMNAPIGSTSTAWTQMNSTNQLLILVAGSTVQGQWAGAADQYLGLALAVGTNTYFGWARFSFSSTSNQYTFKDYAYQSNAGMQILAGENCGSITTPVFTLPDSLCVGTTVTVTAGTGTDTPTSFSWAASPGVSVSASSASSSALTFSAAGSSTVLLLVTNTSTFGAVVHTIEIKPAPTVSITPPTTTICPGSTHTLTAMGNGSSFSWTTNPPSNISSSTSQWVVVTPTTTTNYLVEATLNGCKASANTVLIITQLPTTSLVSTFSMCAQGYNNSKDFTSVVALGYTLSGPSAWPLVVTTNTSGGGAVVTTTPPYFTTNTLVPTTLTLTYGSCSAIMPVSFSITANPTIAVASAPSTLCAGNSGTITVSGSTNYAWMSNAQQGAFTILSPSQAAIAPITNATYSVFGLVSQCSSQIQVINVSVTPGPTLVVGNETTCVGNTATLSASGANTYTWTGPPGGPSSNSFVVVNAGDSEGTFVYTVTGMGTASCTSKKQVSLTVLTCAGILEQGNRYVTFFPQPAKEKLFIETELNGRLQYLISDASGREVKKGRIEIAENQAEVDVSELPNGIYFFKAISGSRKVTEKFLKGD